MRADGGEGKGAGPAVADRPGAEDGAFAVVDAAVEHGVTAEVWFDRRHRAAVVVVPLKDEWSNDIVSLALDDALVEAQLQIVHQLLAPPLLLPESPPGTGWIHVPPLMTSSR